MVNKYGMEPEYAGLVPSLLPFGTIILTPFFGNLYDRKGKGATIMLIGSFLLVFVHVMFAVPINHYIFAALLVIILGVTFSLVPSAMWPSVPKIIPEKQLGTAYALIFWVQNWGLMLVPYLIGWVLEKYCKVFDANGEFVRYDYTWPMLIFAAFGVLAVFVAILLKAEDKRKSYGLEMPNIESRIES
jgi:MFS family permease